MVGSQQVPFIYEDYCSADTTAKAILKLYEMSSEEREALGAKARNYALSQFNLQNTIDEWDKTLTDLTENWKKNTKSWEVREF
jgi:glycosyltransferase involved in cell wall biosynthesis